MADSPDFIHIKCHLDSWKSVEVSPNWAQAASSVLDKDVKAAGFISDSVTLVFFLLMNSRNSYCKGTNQDQFVLHERSKLEEENLLLTILNCFQGLYFSHLNQRIREWKNIDQKCSNFKSLQPNHKVIRFYFSDCYCGSYRPQHKTHWLWVHPDFTSSSRFINLKYRTEMRWEKHAIHGRISMCPQGQNKKQDKLMQKKLTEECLLQQSVSK